MEHAQRCRAEMILVPWKPVFAEPTKLGNVELAPAVAGKEGEVAGEGDVLSAPTTAVIKSPISIGSHNPFAPLFRMPTSHTPSTLLPGAGANATTRSRLRSDRRRLDLSPKGCVGSLMTPQQTWLFRTRFCAAAMQSSGSWVPVYTDSTLPCGRRCQRGESVEGRGDQRVW